MLILALSCLDYIHYSASSEAFYWTLDVLFGPKRVDLVASKQV